MTKQEEYAKLDALWVELFNTEPRTEEIEERLIDIANAMEDVDNEN